MYDLTPSDEFRKAVESIWLNADDMVPVAGKEGLSRLPILSRPELIQEGMRNVMRLYNKVIFPHHIAQRARSQGLHAERRSGPDFYTLRGPESFLFPGEDRMAVFISIRKPEGNLERGPNEAGQARKEFDGKDEVASLSESNELVIGRAVNGTLVSDETADQTCNLVVGGVLVLFGMECVYPKAETSSLITIQYTTTPI